VAKVHYQKQRSRDVARKSSECMQKMIEIGSSENRQTGENSTTAVGIEQRKEKEENHNADLEHEKQNEETSQPIPTDKTATETVRRKKCPFSKEEDNFLIKGIKKHGKGKWTSILNDPEYKFHSSRKNSTLIMRAKAKKII